MEITDEIRAAVLAEQCATQGHLLDTAQLIGSDPTTGGITVRAADPDVLAHVRCERCGHVWLVAVEGATYAAAETALNAQLAPERRRPLRAERRAERIAAEAETVAAENARAQADVQRRTAPTQIKVGPILPTARPS